MIELRPKDIGRQIEFHRDDGIVETGKLLGIATDGRWAKIRFRLFNSRPDTAGVLVERKELRWPKK